MTKHATATTGISSWEEKSFHELNENEKLTWALVTNTFQGDLAATGTMEYLMTYRADGTVITVGMERVVGTLDGREGSFVLKHDGRFAEGVAEGTCTIVPGTGTGELRSLHGQGTIRWPGETGMLHLEYDFGAGDEPSVPHRRSVTNAGG